MRPQTFVYPNKNPQRYFGVDFFAGLFSGSHPTRMYYSTSADIDQTYRADPPVIKTGYPEAFAKELAIAKPGSVIGFYQNPDPYDPRLSESEPMRAALAILVEKRLGVFIETASDLILRDLPSLKELQKQASVMIAVPIGFTNDIIQSRLEPLEANLANKLKTVQKLAAEGLPVGVILKPLIPFVNDTEANIGEIIAKAKQAGARFIYPSFGIVLADDQRQAFMNLIARELPGLRNIFMDTFGLKKSWASPNQKQLKKAFVFNVKKQKLPFGMSDIIAITKPAQEVQIKLF